MLQHIIEDCKTVCRAALEASSVIEAGRGAKSSDRLRLTDQREQIRHFRAAVAAGERFSQRVEQSLARPAAA